jgi:hypothetical protein
MVEMPSRAVLLEHLERVGARHQSSANAVRVGVGPRCRLALKRFQGT